MEYLMQDEILRDFIDLANLRNQFLRLCDRFLFIDTNP